MKIKTPISKVAFPAESWAVTEPVFNPQYNEFLESIFFLGNGYMGVRGTPEEGFSGEGSTPHTYVASVNDRIKMHPDWHIAAYMPYLTVMVPVANWFPVDVILSGTSFDPRTGKVIEYSRSVDMRTGVLNRRVVWEDHKKRVTELTFARFVSLDNLHLGAVRVTATPRNWKGSVEFRARLDASACQQQTITACSATKKDGATLSLKTLETHFDTTMVMRTACAVNGSPVQPVRILEETDKSVTRKLILNVERGSVCRLDKIVAVCSSKDPDKGDTHERAEVLASQNLEEGFDILLRKHQEKWAGIWSSADIGIEGDIVAQQAVRYCIFSMHQNYAGTDPLVNIPAKGLTGPGYGGLYWWDTEAYMIPFFLYTMPEKARMLLMFRYHTLAGARRKAEVYGYKGAMYPWVTITGDECSGDWDYGMLEQHVSSAVTHAIRRYMEATHDDNFLWNYGAEMLVETSRFWASRVFFNPHKNKYVINFVTGPDEYAVGVNNNCYTNYMAMKNLEYGLEIVARMKRECARKWSALAKKLVFQERELSRWRDMVKKMYIPYNKKLGIHEQDDSFLDRMPFDRNQLKENERPVNKKWLWEKLMRSQAMKQADVVLLMLMHNDEFDEKVKRANYLFYEPKTTHESSLSPCVYGIMAAELGLENDAFQYYLRTARLDLDDVNGNTSQGQHTAAIAGGWASVVNGFGGMRICRGELSFNPKLPKRWKSLAFTVTFRGRKLQLEIFRKELKFILKGESLTILLSGRRLQLKSGVTVVPS